ncbi:MAG: hypothetical protein QOI41_3599 [Myxococcales bacterium]|nr:hypothetical protein [Myxococcales bacterium]
MKHAICTLPLLVLIGCGGAAKGPDSAANGSSKNDGGEPHESIGDMAAAQGGLAALGGNGNREDGSTGVEVAFGGALHAEDVDKKSPVKLDGVLKEWPVRSAAKETLSGTTAGLALGVAVQMDDAKLYVAAEVTDPNLARSARHVDSDDHVSMTLAFPAGRGGLKAYEIGLYAGKPGDSPGAVKWLAGPNKGQDVAGAKLVEYDVKGGFTFEAAIPWSTFAEARTMRVGLRAALRYHDGDGSTVRGVLGTGPGSVDRPGDLPALPTAAEQAVVDGLLAQKNLVGTAPKIDVFADVTGDERKERISVFGKFFTICGPGYRGGRQFFWREVGGELSSFETRDLSARGKDDMIVRRRVTQNNIVHELLEVWTVASSGDEPTTIFTQEIAVTDGPGRRRIANAVRVSAAAIEVSVEPAQGWDASSFRETSAAASTDEAILLPWGTVRSRTFKLEKGKFVKAGEVAQAGSSAPAAAAGSGTGTATATASTSDLPTPAVGKSTDLGHQVMDAYYKDQSITPGTKPRFDIEVHVDGDGRPERVALVGRDIVVLGPGFKSGTGYARMSLTQFADDKDVSELTARDVTGDGAAELVVRGVRHVTTPAGDRVDVQALFIYQVKNGAIARVFSVETGREQASKRVQGLVQFVPSKAGKGFDVDVRPGVARGWTEKTYPWPQDKAGGSIEPLLLPWGGISSLRYVWNGTQFTTP